MKAGNMDMSKKEVMGMVGERWKNLDQDLRREYAIETRSRTFKGGAAGRPV